VDDIFAVWPHGMDELHKFEQHPNNIHNSIKFTMEADIKGLLTFLDVCVTRKPDSPL
jgi:hypothetical protein